MPGFTIRQTYGGRNTRTAFFDAFKKIEQNMRVQHPRAVERALKDVLRPIATEARRYAAERVGVPKKLFTKRIAVSRKVHRSRSMRAASIVFKVKHPIHPQWFSGNRFKKGGFDSVVGSHKGQLSRTFNMYQYNRIRPWWVAIMALGGFKSVPASNRLFKNKKAIFPIFRRQEGTRKNPKKATELYYDWSKDVPWIIDQIRNPTEREFIKSYRFWFNRFAK